MIITFITLEFLLHVDIGNNVTVKRHTQVFIVSMEQEVSV